MTPHHHSPTRAFLLLPLLVLLTTGLAAQEKAAPWYESITVSGFVSAAGTYNLGRPDTGVNSYRVFDQKDNSFTVDVYELSFKRDAVEAGSAGFRVDLAAGASVPRVSRSAGLGGDIDLQQMYVTWVAPLGNGLRLDLGKFVTPHGYEVIEGTDGFNDNYSRSFLFGYAIPFTHTGLRASYAFSPSFSLMAMAINGWDNAVDNNQSKTVGGQVFVSPAGGVSLYGSIIYGPERDGNNSDNRMVLDVCASWAATDALTVACNVDNGSEAGLVNGESATWTGVAGYLRYAFNDRFALALRGELFNDADGARTGVAQKLTEFTVTPEYRPAPHLILRAEFRMDLSDQQVFRKQGDATDSQSTIGINAMYTF
jgi:hypothetical protein